MPKATHYWHRRPNKRNCAMVTSLQMTRKTIASPKGNALASVNNLNFGRTRSTPCMRFPSDYFFARLQTSPLTGTYIYRTSIVPWEFFMILWHAGWVISGWNSDWCPMISPLFYFVSGTGWVAQRLVQVFFRALRMILKDYRWNHALQFLCFIMFTSSKTGWCFGTMEFYDFPFTWECHDPNWRFVHHFSEG